MSKVLDGFKMGFGIFLFFALVFGIVFAVGFHSADEILGGTFLGDYVFQGNVKLDNSASVCNAGQEGSIRYNGTVFEGCNGTDWDSLSSLTQGGGVDTYTKLMLHFDNVWIDNSSSTHSVTNNGASFTSSGHFSQASYFDGTNDYLSIPDSEDFNFGNSAFTIDFWMKTPSATRGTHFYILDKGYNKVGDNGNYAIALNSNFASLWFWALDEQASGEGNTINYVFSPDTWYHIAYTKEGNTMRGFVNGNLLETTTVNKALGDNDEPLLIGMHNPSYGYFEGNIDELRISKGVVRWSSSFTPPTGPYS